MKKISIGICCYNEEQNIELMYHAIKKEMDNFTTYDYEIIFEDNNSQDNSQKILRKIASEDKRVKVILNQTNFGVNRSTVNCMDSATGDAFIGITCDFQDPPEMVPNFIRGWEEGYEVVWGQKTSSKENPVAWLCRKIYYYIIDKFSEYRQLHQVIAFGLMDRSVLNILLQTIKQDPDVHVRHLVCEYGFKVKLLPYQQQKRLHGKSSYSLASYYSFAITSLCNTSTKPLRMMTVLGMLIATGSLVVALVYFIYKILFWNTFNPGMAPLVIGMFFISAVQLFCIGILGEYIGILLRKMVNKPIVVERERINFDEEN